MAIDTRGAVAGGIIYGDHGTQFTSWTFTERARRAGLLPSVGSVGDPYDNTVAVSFWARMQTELLNRRRRNTRVELANAIFECTEGFHNRRRRHSALGWQTPIRVRERPTCAAADSSHPCPNDRGMIKVSGKASQAHPGEWIERRFMPQPRRGFTTRNAAPDAPRHRS
ncbi:hypothetical protein GCM10009687_06440 [Asanoa iriomotensis]|uniref:Integrase catalytic domain-containing protein n=1 Tax=Asanoa iriomotensis TaxID=234613 RepID=A0ABQ4C328_9ACTN|nr:hypothetical protein Air01nite_27900 [Asanoa iriomotensis]